MKQQSRSNKSHSSRAVPPHFSWSLLAHTHLRLGHFSLELSTSPSLFFLHLLFPLSTSVIFLCGPSDFQNTARPITPLPEIPSCFSLSFGHWPRCPSGRQGPQWVSLSSLTFLELPQATASILSWGLCKCWASAPGTLYPLVSQLSRTGSPGLSASGGLKNDPNSIQVPTPGMYLRWQMWFS